MRVPSGWGSASAGHGTPSWKKRFCRKRRRQWRAWAVVQAAETDLAMKSTGADGEELLIALLMELAVKKGA